MSVIHALNVVDVTMQTLNHSVYLPRQCTLVPGLERKEHFIAKCYHLNNVMSCQRTMQHLLSTMDQLSMILVD